MQLITEEYRDLNKKLHEEREDYGASSARWAPQIRDLCEHLETKDVLDYGCGKCKLAFNLPFTINNYDPCIDEFNYEPDPADIVVCTDVLEHIEPDCIDDVISHLLVLTKKCLFLNVATRPAAKTLADGRNAHLIVQSANWWIGGLIKLFNVVNINVLEGQL